MFRHVKSMICFRQKISFEWPTLYFGAGCKGGFQRGRGAVDPEQKRFLDRGPRTRFVVLGVLDFSTVWVVFRGLT